MWHTQSRNAKHMSKKNTKLLTYLLLILPTVLVLQIWLTLRPVHEKIVNTHESIEQLSDVAKLKSAMEELGITTTVLHGIPTDLLRYSPGDDIDLSEVGNNHNTIAQAAESYPDEFHFFCTIDPTDSKRAVILEECIEDGAIGVKFYIGYSYSHSIALDDESLEPFYSLLEDKQMILMYPVNTALYKLQLENVLVRHPNLDVICSHYCLASKDIPRLDALMDIHPNLYVDSSFGHASYFEDGLLTITSSHDEFKEFFIEHQDRILFATDNVITTYEGKDLDWVLDLTHDYIRLLSEQGIFPSSTDGGNLYRGLGLPYSVQRKVFWQNWDELLQ